MRSLLLGVCLALAVAVIAGGAGAAAAGADSRTRHVAQPAPVPSLDPSATAELWHQLVATKSLRSGATAECRPLRAVFYAATDFLRLATKLAERASPCAQYYISIPPLVSDKTLARPNAAWRIRALGPNFHAMAEFHFATWTRWVASTGSSWYTAGVTARQRMAAAGFDVANGDIWVMNELTTAVRRGTGNARANVRELLRGLYEGDGIRPTRGAVFVVGVGQRSTDLSLYQANLQNWFTDTAFWTDMATYVSDWTQEVYGDVRSYAAPGVPTSARRDYLNDYLQHKLVLAGAGPPTIETARSFLQATFSPLANAAWERDTGYGWTMVSPEQMAGYASAQVNALRYFSQASGQAQDHWGFAWAPRNANGMSAADFAVRTNLVLDRLATAVRDSGQVPDPVEPGSSACGPPGQNVWCVGDLEGARPAEGWRSFRAWTQSAISLGTPPPTVAVGQPSAPINLSLVTSTGLAVTTPTPLTVTLSSSSAQGEFSASPAGPWMSTLTLTIGAGSGTGGVFHYRDTRAGSHVLTASAAGATPGTQTVTVIPGPVAALTVRPASAVVRARASLRFTATGTDSFGNAVQVSPAWSLTPRTLGAVAPRTGSATTLVAARDLGPGSVVASVATGAGQISASAAVRVAAGRLRIGSIRYRARAGSVLVTVRAMDVGGRPISAARIFIAIKRNGQLLGTSRALSGADGRAIYRVPARRAGCFTTAIRRVSAAGFTWDSRTPKNRYCPRQSD
jgi:hypothetical protein